MTPSPASGPATIETVNAQHWSNPSLSRDARRGLRRAETGLIERYRDALRGDVLELAPSGGRLTEELVRTATSVTGIGPSGTLIGLCRQFHRSGNFIQDDIRSLDRFEPGEFTAVVAGRCVIDLLSEEHRRQLLDDLHRIIKPGGVLLFSSHNLECRPSAAAAAGKMASRPLGAVGRLIRLPQTLRNRANHSRLEESEEDYAVLTGPEHDHRLMDYHIGRDAQERQLSEYGFQMLECVDLDDSQVPAGEPAAGCLELHYAARRVER